VKTLEVLDKVLKGKRVKNKTKKNYVYALTSLAKYSEEWPSDPVVINEWLNQLSGYASSSVHTWFRYVRSAGRYMEKISGKNQYGAYNMPNPTTDAERPKVEHAELLYRTPDEMVACLKVCRNRYEYCLVSVLIDSAVRIGELGRHKDEPDKYPGLYGCDVGENFIRVRGKTGERRHRLNRELCIALKALAGGDDKPVFKRKDGMARTDNHLAYDVRVIVKRAGISGKKLGPHSFRHGSASLVAKVTQSALSVKSVLVHDEISTSMKYIHDAEHDIADGISPLAIIEGKVKGINHEQLLLGAGGVETVEPDGVVVDMAGEIIEGEDLVAELFPVIPDSAQVRPLLKVDDLRLIREVMVEYARAFRGDVRIYKGQELLMRMLRRVK
jgi:integrase